MLFVLLVVAIVSVLAYYNFVWKRKGLPPGPTPLPFFGNNLELGRLTPGYEAFMKWAREYGPVYTYWLGETPVVAVTDFALIKEAFIKDGDSYTGRDLFNPAFKTMKITDYGVHSLGRSEGEEWQQLRRFGLRVLRDLGVGRGILEEKILEEAETLISEVEEDLNRDDIKYYKEGYDLLQPFEVAVGSIINTLVFGFRFVGEDRKEYYELRPAMDKIAKSMFGPVSGNVLYTPWLRFFPVFRSAFKNFENGCIRLYAFMDRQIQLSIERRKSVGEEEDASGSTHFVDAFLKEMESRRDDGSIPGKDHFFTMPALRGSCQDLFLAGQETTANTLKFMLLYLMIHPEVQDKMQVELDKILAGEKRRITLADRPKMPYTNAVIMETQRYCNLLPMNLLRKPTRDVVLGGHKIAKGTLMAPQISCVLLDEKIFPEPDKFKPERFLDEHGQVVKCEALIPFGCGKRLCSGESLSKMELFLLAVNVFDKFKIRVLDPDNMPDMTKIPGLTVSPVPFKCRIEMRKRATEPVN